MSGAQAGIKDVLRQFTELFSSPLCSGVVNGEIIATGATGAVGLDQTEQAPQVVGTVIQPVFKRGWVDQGGVLGQQGTAGQFVVVSQQVQRKKTQWRIKRDWQLDRLYVQVVAQTEGSGDFGYGGIELRMEVEQGSTSAVELGLETQQQGVGVGIVACGVSVDAIDQGDEIIQAANTWCVSGRRSAVPQADGVKCMQGQAHLAAQAAERGVFGRGHGQRAQSKLRLQADGLDT